MLAQSQTTPPQPEQTVQPDVVRQLQTRISVLNAQRSVIVDRTRSDNPAFRDQALKDLYKTDLELAQVRAQLASMQGQSELPGGATPGATGGTTAPPPLPSTPWIDKVDPDAITAVFILTALAFLIPMSVGLSRRLWRRPAPAPSQSLEDRISPRLDRLEQAVDAVAIEVERISESQRFVTRVLSERPAVVAPNPPADVAPLGEAKPFLALGAGPMEPVRVPERQAVKQSVTPH
jgi:hypothetical protein